MFLSAAGINSILKRARQIEPRRYVNTRECGASGASMPPSRRIRTLEILGTAERTERMATSQQELQRARAALGSGNPRAAARACQKVLTDNPRDLNARYLH